jgi:hypothetical protein
MTTEPPPPVHAPKTEMPIPRPDEIVLPPSVDPNPLPPAPPTELPEQIIEGSDQGNHGYAAHVESYLTSAKEEAEAAHAAPVLGLSARALNAAEAADSPRSKSKS